jgi:chromosomal replication initiator protein
VNPQDAWRIAYNQLELQLDRASFDTWLRGTIFIDADANGNFRIGVQNAYARDMLEFRLYREIRRVLGDVLGIAVQVQFELVHAEPVAAQDDELPLFKLMNRQPAPEVETSAPLHPHVARPQRPDLPECELNPRLTFDRFVANNANRITLEAALAVAENPGNLYNPFLIYGGVGLGKTHLLQSIAHACRARGQRVIYIPSEVFTNDLIDAIRQRTTAMFREKYRSVDVLLVDDIQFIAGKESTQEEFFHTFNALNVYNKQVVLASDRHPSELHTLEDRLRSRFEGGLVMDLQPPEFETRLAILNMWAQERGVQLPAAAAEMLADRARTNIRELEGVFNQMMVTAQLSRRPLTADAAESALAGYRRPRHHGLSLTRVLEATASYYKVLPDDLIGPRRTARLNQARQVAMYLAREVTLASLPQIGEAFGGRTHSTVLHSCNKLAAELETSELLQRDVQAIQSVLIEDNDSRF